MTQGQDLVDRTDPYANRRRWIGPIVAVLLLAAGWATLSLGAVAIPPGEVLGVLARKLGLDVLTEPSSQAEAVVWGIRMPRLALGLAVGATLALAGAVLQGLLRNDLADPHLLGIGPGAAIGAAVGSSVGGVQGAIAGGVAAGVFTAFAVRRLARRASLDPNRIILSGVALGAALSAWVGFVVFAADRATVPPIEFWLLGSLAGSSWRAFGTVVVYIVIAAAVMLGSARLLDIFRLGESEARHLGIDVDLVRTVILVTVGAAVGATVGSAGVIAFVGLLVPFVVIRFTGPLHRHLLGMSLAAGALFVVTSDLVARLAIQPIEIPVGLVTAAVGGPTFLWLLTRQRDV
ncbi:MAG: iron ABC transporter permease [Deltaproteobacteria bacterium]|nr:iron ABC transporter permease [Deltaproteobacteria bacterium]